MPTPTPEGSQRPSISQKVYILEHPGCRGYMGTLTIDPRYSLPKIRCDKCQSTRVFRNHRINLDTHS